MEELIFDVKEENLLPISELVEKKTGKGSKEMSTQIYKKVFGLKENHYQVNRYVKSVIIDFGEKHGGEVVVKNDNFGTTEKYADFTNGKKEAGLHPMQIVFRGIDTARELHDKFVAPDDKIYRF